MTKIVYKLCVFDYDLITKNKYVRSHGKKHNSIGFKCKHDAIKTNGNAFITFSSHFTHIF